MHCVCAPLQILGDMQTPAPPVPQRHRLIPASHVGAWRLPEHVEEVPHIHDPATHISPAVLHVTPSQGSIVVAVLVVVEVVVVNKIVVVMLDSTLA